METNGQLHGPNILPPRRMNTIPDGFSNPILTLLDYRKIPCPTMESNRHSCVKQPVVQSYTNWAILAPWCRCAEQKKKWKELTDVECTGYTQKNGAVSKVIKKFISHLTRVQRTPSAAATVQVSHAQPAVRFSFLMRGRGAILQTGPSAPH